jgi:hypothetical protein
MQGATDPGSPLPVRGGEAATVADMEKPMQWMTSQELRDELERTRPAWDDLANLDGFPADGQHPALGEDAHRYQLVANELLRRPSDR